MSGIPKRNRNVLSIEAKMQILSRLEKGESGSSLAKLFNVGTATISDIKSKKDVILTFAAKLDSEDARGSMRRKTMKKPKDEKLEEAVYSWFLERRSSGAHITGPRLCEKALTLNKDLGGPPNFKASTGWLKNFKSRHGIREFDLDVHLEPFHPSGDVPSAGKFKETFLSLVKKEGYSLDDVYHSVETGLNWKSLPSRCLASKRESATPGCKASKEQITVLLTANTTATHPLTPLVIGKYKKPRCFKNITQLPLCYKAQNCAWMNREIFLEWYSTEFIPNVKKYREDEKKSGKVILILDDTPSHPDVETLNAVDPSVKVVFLPVTVTALLRPTDQVFIQKLKMIYKKQVLRRLLLARDEESAVALSKELSLKDCCHMVADAWNTLSKDFLEKSSKRVFGANEETDTGNFTDVDLNEITDLFRAIPGFSDCDKVDAQMWLENNNDPSFQIFNDDKIGSGVREEVMTDNEDVVGGPSHEEAFAALETVMSWYEKQEESCPAHLLLLNGMRELAATKRLSNVRSKVP